MGNLDAFLAMGGYAAFVWSAYGLAFAVLSGLTLHSWWRYRESTAALEELRQMRGKKR
jgi:heme exporter protein D